jgi:hypothetical protein
MKPFSRRLHKLEDCFALAPETEFTRRLCESSAAALSEADAQDGRVQNLRRGLNRGVMWWSFRF